MFDIREIRSIRDYKDALAKHLDHPDVRALQDELAKNNDYTQIAMCSLSHEYKEAPLQAILLQSISKIVQGR